MAHIHEGKLVRIRPFREEELSIYSQWRLDSETEEGNQPARRSLEKCGMQFEGVARHLFFDMGRWVNMAVYSILRPEWEALPLYEEYRRPFTEPWG